MLNFWVSSKEILAGWRGKFSFEAGLSNLDQQLSFLVKVNEAAEQEHVRQALEPPIGHSEYLKDSDSSRYTHAQYLQAYYFQTGEISYCSSISSTRLCYYDLEGKLVESDIKDAGKLLETLHPDKEWCRRNMSYGVPVRLIVQPERVSSSLSKVNISDAQSTDVEEERTVEVSIFLYSDIWFPWVVGWLEERRTPDDKYDNRELAQCHTPRLNRFISTVRELILDYGGNWSIAYPDPFIGFYASMLTEHGILLYGMPKI
jgi:hypothetical protein